MLNLVNQDPAVQSVLDQLMGENVSRFKLENGLSVVAKEDVSAELVSVQLWVKSGSIHEGDHLGCGLSHYLEHMLFKGTEKRMGGDISRQVHTAGGYINAYTTYDRTVYYIDLPSESVELAVDILADMGLNASLPADEVEKEKEVILREIDMGMDDPDRLLFQEFVQTAYRVHPYQHPVIGWRSLFEQVDRDSLVDYYRSRYVPNNMVLLVVGAVPVASVRRLAEMYFGKHARSRLAPVAVPPEPVQLAVRENRGAGDFQLVRGMIGWKIRGLGHPDTPGLEVLANLLGHGKSSLLHRSLREGRKLVHSISAGCWVPGDHGLFWVSYLCDPGKREQVEDAVATVVEELVETGAPPEAVAKVLRQAVVSEVNARKSMAGQASRLGIAEVVVGEPEYTKVYLDQLAGVEAGRLAILAKKYLQSPAVTRCSLEPQPTDSVSGQAAQATVIPSFEQMTLANGVRILSQPVQGLPKINIHLAALGSALLEKQESRGATSLLATLLTKDTARQSRHEIAAMVERAGGSFNEFCGNNAFGLEIEVLSQDWEMAVSLLEDAVLHATFREDVFQREKEAQLADLKEDEDEVFQHARRALRQRFFGRHPYAVDPLGTRESLEKMTLEDVESLRNKLLVGSNLVVSVSGQFEPETVCARLSAVFEKLPEGKVLPADIPFQGPAENGLITEKMKREQAVVLRAFPDPGIRTEDFEAMQLMEELFSGMSSRLFQVVREEQGLAYYVGATRMSGLDTGMFLFYAGTHPGATDKVLEAIEAEILRVQQGEVTEEEMVACRTHLKAQKRKTRQRPGIRTVQSALSALYGQDINQWQQFDQKIDRVTVKDLQRLACEYFQSEKSLGYVVIPEKATKE